VRWGRQRWSWWTTPRGLGRSWARWSADRVRAKLGWLVEFRERWRIGRVPRGDWGGVEFVRDRGLSPGGGEELADSAAGDEGRGRRVAGGADRVREFGVVEGGTGQILRGRRRCWSRASAS